MDRNIFQQAYNNYVQTPHSQKGHGHECEKIYELINEALMTQDLKREFFMENLIRRAGTLFKNKPEAEFAIKYLLFEYQTLHKLANSRLDFPYTKPSLTLALVAPGSLDP